MLLCSTRDGPVKASKMLKKLKKYWMLPGLMCLALFGAQADGLAAPRKVGKPQILGPGTIQGLLDEARSYYRKGMYAEAEPLLERSVDLSKKLFGPYHPEVATCLNELANLYRTQGRYSEAEPLFKQALIIRKQSFGADHAAVGESLNSLARPRPDR